MAMKGFLFWTPRILGIVFALFLSLFSLDVLDEGLGLWDTVLGLLLHLVPAFIVAAVLLLSWKRGWVGAVLFTALAVFYMIWLRGRFHWSAYALISGTLALIGILFLLDWIYSKRKT